LRDARLREKRYAATLAAMNRCRKAIVGLLIVAMPLSATASFAASLSCPHQGLGAALAHGVRHDHGAMTASMDRVAGTATLQHDHAAMLAAHLHDAAHATGGHHGCDCVHHCAGANPASSMQALALDDVVGPTARSADYRSFHSDSTEVPLLRPPIMTAA
jgi:hypothetical protein